MRRQLFAAAGVAALALAGCTLPQGSSDPLVGFGPNPPLPAPKTALIPMVGVPKVVNWAPEAAPEAPPPRQRCFGQSLLEFQPV